MTPEKFKAREFFTGGGPSQPFKITGSVTAIDVTTGKDAGKLRRRSRFWAAFSRRRIWCSPANPRARCWRSTPRRWRSCWEFNTGGGVNAPPMTFSVDGKQYVAILVGLGGAWDKWFIDATPELKKMQPGSMLYVFAL